MAELEIASCLPPPPSYLAFLPGHMVACSYSDDEMKIMTIKKNIDC
jgi:hypothetical protein